MTKGLILVHRQQFAGHIILALFGSACHSRSQRLLINPIPAQSSAEIQSIRHVKVSVAKQVESRRNKFTIRDDLFRCESLLGHYLDPLPLCPKHHSITLALDSV